MHCCPICIIAGAWNVVHLRGEARVLVPRLVTGLKIWHMRQAGIFYPKHSFLTTMANLPDGAQVKPPSPPPPLSLPLSSLGDPGSAWRSHRKGQLNNTVFLQHAGGSFFSPTVHKGMLVLLNTIAYTMSVICMPRYQCASLLDCFSLSRCLV